MFLLSKSLLLLGALVLQSQSHEMPQEEIELRPSSEISGTAPLDQHNSETALMDFIMNLPGLNKSQQDFPDRDTSRERANNYPVNIPVMKLNRTARQLPIHPANMLFLQQQQQQQALAVAHLNQQLLNNNRNRFNNNNRNNQDNTNYDDDSSEEDESGSDEYFSNNPIQRGVFPSGPGFRSDIPTEVDRLGESETSQDNPSYFSVKSNLTDSAELSPEFHSHNASHDDPSPSDSVSVKLDLSSDQAAGSISEVPSSEGTSAHSSGERPSHSDFVLYKPIEEKSYSAIFPIESANPSTVGDVTTLTENAGSDSVVPNYESEGRSSASSHNTRISESAASELEDSFHQAFKTTASAKKPINPIVQGPDEDSPVKISDSQGTVSDDGYDLNGAATTGHSKVFKRASTTPLASEIGGEEGGSSSTPCNNLRNCWCGTPTTKMISVGAINVQTSLFPWLVSIHSSGSHLCTGNIISSNYILTAASCVHRIPANMILVTTSLTSRKPKTLRVEKIVNYSGRNKMPKENDLVLLKLHGSMTPGRHLKYACLPTNFTESKLQRGILVSFTHDFSTNKLTLLQTHVDQISSKKCHKMNSAPKNSTFCTLPRKKTCQANSGGSFVTRGKAYSFVMTGINTGAPGCKKTGKATTYTRIEPYLEWIMKETLDSSFCKNRNTRDLCTLSRVLDSDLDDDESLPE